MSRFQTLLVPHDFSTHSGAALDAAIDLAQGLGAQVALVHVYHRPITMFEPYGILPVEPAALLAIDGVVVGLDAQVRAASAERPTANLRTRSAICSAAALWPPANGAMS